MKDLIIIGASAAGVSAGIYAARRKLNFEIITCDIGGEVATSGEIMNYPGFIHTNGIELAEKFKEHIESYKPDMEVGVTVERITKTDGYFAIKANKLGESAEYQAKAVIIATGAKPRELNIPGEKEFRGKGVTYCTVCDGPLFAGKAVATVGGGNSALESALMLSEIAKQVYVLTINPEMKGEKVLIDKMVKARNVKLISSAFASKISGENFVKELEYTNKDQSRVGKLDIDGIFVHIGMIPNSQMSDAAKTEFGDIIIDQLGRTNIAGLFAAGDVTNIPYKQIAISTGQGVTAALSAISYLDKLESNNTQ